MQPEESAGGETFGMRWVKRRTTGRKGLGMNHETRLINNIRRWMNGESVAWSGLRLPLGCMMRGLMCSGKTEGVSTWSTEDGVG